MNSETIGEYKLGEVVGKGGMATVYRAYQPSVDREVAIKVLPGQLSEDPTFLKRFQHEARMIARLEHRAILPIYAYGEQDGTPYIVMRLLEGGSLRRRLFEGPLDLPTTVKLIEQVAEALDYAHSRGVVHRDLKPSNILLDEQFNAYLTDFGIAKMLGRTTQITGHGVVGTPHYMSPERCQGKAATPASDIYSLGAILFELLTGEPPFDADTPLAVMYMQVREPIPSITDFNPALPEELAPIIARTMAKRPEERHPTAQALADDLKRTVERISARTVGTGRPDYSKPKPQKKARPRPATGRKKRLRWVIIPAALVAAAALGWLIMTSINGQASPDDSATSTQQPTQQAQDTPSDEPPTETLPTEAIQSTPEAAPTFAVNMVEGPAPSGTGRLAFFTQGASDTAELASMGIDGTGVMALTENAVYDGEPDWSPDGSQVAFESSETGNKDIYILDVESGDVQQVTTSPQPDRHPDWSPDGASIIYESGSGDDIDLYVIETTGGEPQQLTSNTYGDRAPQFSPDGSQIAYMTRQRGLWEIAILSYPEGEQIAIFDCPAVDCRFPAWSPDGQTIAYNTLDDLGNLGGIWILDVSSGLTQVLYDVGQNGRPDWSGDGNTLFFNHTDGENSDLYRLDLDTGSLYRLTETPVDEFAPDWAPG